MTLSNLQRVRMLYKTILKLHRGLPKELQELGTNYARDEFKRHKKCEAKEAAVFISEWTGYALSLAEQLGVKGPRTGKTFGEALSQCDLNQFNDQQICQLYELMEAAQIPEAQEEKH